MNERKLHFWVGLFCLAVMTMTGLMVFQFGKLGQHFRPRYAIAIHFEETPGLFSRSPVMMNGLTIGVVSDVQLDDQRGGVLVTAQIEEKFKLRKDTEVHLRKSLLGDASLEFTPGLSAEWLEPGALLSGNPPSDPFEMVTQMQTEVTKTLRAFNETSSEWKQVASNMNRLIETKEGNLDEVLEKTVLSLSEFTQTMKKASDTLLVAQSLLGDPENQANLKRTLAALPRLTEETGRTIATVKATVETINQAAGKIDQNLANLNEVTKPLAQHSKSIIIRLDGSLANLQSVTKELDTFVKLTNTEEGSLRKLAVDPELYDNLNRSAIQLAILLKNADPLVKDLQIFSDKIARHPELIGVGGALKGSSGLKNEEAEQITRKPGLFGN
ncbi:MAG: MlaD family protein [Planctomycetaceae bacterium]|jgi:phospholipid/cholesterol/gamma-HCH transport system substrate-binding protein|nr:MlaD family protein [Planctomycetaceae bacterium]